MTTPAPSRPVTDSPWLWGYLFGMAALGALLLIAPKYTRRQAQLERQFAGREWTWERKLAPALPETGAEGQPSVGLIITLRPLFVLVGGLTIAAWLAFWFSRRGVRGLAGDLPDAAESKASRTPGTLPTEASSREKPP